MTIVYPDTQTVNNQFAETYTKIMFDEMIESASASYVQAMTEHGSALAWNDYVQVFRNIHEANFNVDFSAFPTPPAPQAEVEDDFNQWVDEMESEFGDMADATIAIQSGIGMF